jgi:hypothetical protein
MEKTGMTLARRPLPPGAPGRLVIAGLDPVALTALFGRILIPL